MDDKLKYELRKVTLKDCDLLFKWANDKSVRENAFNSNEILYDEHVAWFNSKLKSDDSLMYIFKVGYDDVGLMRLDRIDDWSLLITYSIDRAFRGRGYATALLKLVKTVHESRLLIGKVKPTNIASIKAFIKAGYVMKEESGVKVFYSKAPAE